MYHRPIQIILLVLLSLSSFAQTLDPSFGNDGLTRVKINNPWRIICDIHNQGDKILVVGQVKDSLLFARFSADGDIDNQFGENGKVTLDGFPTLKSAIVQPNQKIVIGSSILTENSMSYDFFLARFQPDGTIDENFGNNGKKVLLLPGNLMHESVEGLAMQQDKIVFCGSSGNVDAQTDLVVGRLLANGEIDASFAGNGFFQANFGYVSAVAQKIKVLDNQKILVLGFLETYTNRHSIVLRLNSNGTLDTDFGTYGIAAVTFPQQALSPKDMAIQPDGKILVAAETSVNINSFPKISTHLIRLNSDGSLDLSFGEDGFSPIDTAFYNSSSQISITALDNGEILVNESIGDLKTGFISRFSNNGQLDVSFGENGRLNIPMGHAHFGHSMMPQSTKIIVSGYKDYGDEHLMLARYIFSPLVGVVDFVEKESMVIYPNPILTETIFTYTLRNDEVLDLALYDLSGKLVKNFFSSQKQASGQHQVSLFFDEGIPSGNYVFRLSSGQGSSSVLVSRYRQN